MAITPPVLRECTITSREHTPPGFWCVRLREPTIARSARPAQYVALDLPGPFSLRVPLGIWTSEGDEFSVLFQQWGQRTSQLVCLPTGTAVSCIGPLGNAFSIPARGERAYIVAGGLGVAAFWLLARELQRARIETTIVLGARRKALIIGAEQLTPYGFPIELCTDDGSVGFRGSVVQRLATLPRPDVLFGCGPRGMLQALCHYANAQQIRCEVSVEENFACSMGTCWGCVVPVRRGSAQGTGYPQAPGERRDYDFARACTDGTVFTAAELLWLQ